MLQHVHPQGIFTTIYSAVQCSTALAPRLTNSKLYTTLNTDNATLQHRPSRIPRSDRLFPLFCLSKTPQFPNTHLWPITSAANDMVFH